jgi:heterogeneous nuclear ribonucleoprotein A1/A3
LQVVVVLLLICSSRGLVPPLIRVCVSASVWSATIKMDFKKRKLEENGAITGGGGSTPSSAVEIPKDDVKKFIELFNKEQLVEILEDAATRHADVLEDIRKLADKDPAHRKIFVRGLGWDTTSDTLKTVFAQFGEVEEGVVILDKGTGKSRGFGFVTFRHMDGAQRSLKEPSKRIDGRMTVCQLAATGAQASVASSTQEVSQRKIYVGNVPMDLAADRLLALFSGFGEIEEGPLGFDKVTGRSRGFALIIFKTVEAAKRALQEPIKMIDGQQMYCKLAVEGQKQRHGGTQGKSDDDVYRGGPQVSTPQSAVPAGSNFQYGSGNPGLITTGVPYNQGISSGMNSGLHSGLPSHNQSLKASLNPSYSLTQPLTTPLGHSLNTSLNPSLNSSFTPGVGQVQTSLGVASYGTQLGMPPYGAQQTGLGGQPTVYSSMGGLPLYGSAANLVASQQGAVFQTTDGHYAYASYQNPQLPVSSAPRTSSVVGLATLPSYYNF